MKVVKISRQIPHTSSSHSNITLNAINTANAEHPKNLLTAYRGKLPRAFFVSLNAPALLFQEDSLDPADGARPVHRPRRDRPFGPQILRITAGFP